jgi:phycobilisome rod-core linker protein
MTSTANRLAVAPAACPPKPGDPENFLNMARMLNPKPAARQNISVFDLKIPDMTTNRR